MLLALQDLSIEELLLQSMALLHRNEAVVTPDALSERYAFEALGHDIIRANVHHACKCHSAKGIFSQLVRSPHVKKGKAAVCRDGACV